MFSNTQQQLLCVYRPIEDATGSPYTRLIWHSFTVHDPYVVVEQKSNLDPRRQTTKFGSINANEYQLGPKHTKESKYKIVAMARNVYTTLLKSCVYVNEIIQNTNASGRYKRLFGIVPRDQKIEALKKHIDSTKQVPSQLGHEAFPFPKR